MSASNTVTRFSFRGRILCDGEGLFNPTQRFVDPFPTYKFTAEIEDSDDFLHIERLVDEAIRDLGSPYSYHAGEEEIGYYRPRCDQLKGTTIEFDCLDQPRVSGAAEGEFLGYREASFRCHLKSMKSGLVVLNCDYVDVVPLEEREPVSATAVCDDDF
jgi:hypothetical protein